MKTLTRSDQVMAVVVLALIVEAGANIVLPLSIRLAAVSVTLLCLGAVRWWQPDQTSWLAALAIAGALVIGAPWSCVIGVPLLLAYGAVRVARR